MKRIYLTVDVECHDIERQNQYIWGKVGDEEYGIKKILDLGAELKIPINFFVDFPESEVYGHEFINKITELIISYGQPVFLHVHPTYLSGVKSKSFMWQYTYEEQLELLRKSIGIYTKSMKRTSCPALRIGRYGVDQNTYKVMQSLKLQTIDLSYAWDCPNKCKLSLKENHSSNVPVKYSGQVLMPNTRYIGYDYFGQKRTFGLDVSETQYGEFEMIMERNSLSQIVLTMHSWDLVIRYFFSKSYIKANIRNIEKFKKMVLLAKTHGYEYSNIEQHMPVPNLDAHNQVVNVCDSFLKQILCLWFNFMRFKNIARINVRYFIMFGFAYCVLTAALIALIVKLVKG